MENQKTDVLNATLTALEDALKIIEERSRQKADAGAAYWIKPNGEKIVVRITPEDCDRISGMVFTGGPVKNHNF